jgi:hypothetical protein
MSSNKETALEIKQIFDENELTDLKRFMNKRACLNCTNQYMSYLFHLVQSAGILTTTIAAGYDQKYLVLIGVGLNFLASLITIYEKTNDSILKKLIIDIKTIKDGNYVDEGALIDVGSNKDSRNNDNDTDDTNETNIKREENSTNISRL